MRKWGKTCLVCMKNSSERQLWKQAVDERGQRKMDRLVGADREAAVTQTTLITLYKSRKRNIWTLRWMSFNNSFHSCQTGPATWGSQWTQTLTKSKTEKSFSGSVTLDFCWGSWNEFGISSMNPCVSSHLPPTMVQDWQHGSLLMLQVFVGEPLTGPNPMDFNNHSVYDSVMKTRRCWSHQELS